MLFCSSEVVTAVWTERHHVPSSHSCLPIPSSVLLKEQKRDATELIRCSILHCSLLLMCDPLNPQEAVHTLSFTDVCITTERRDQMARGARAGSHHCGAGAMKCGKRQGDRTRVVKCKWMQSMCWLWALWPLIKIEWGGPQGEHFCPSQLPATALVLCSIEAVTNMKRQGSVQTNTAKV